MRNQKSLLIICRESRDLPLVDRFKDSSSQSIVVASDRVQVQQAAVKRPWVDKVCFIEQMESFYAVADDVLRILDIVNQWLVSLAENGNGVPKELLFFERHTEGGMTTQRIQDSLLLIRSYRSLFEEHNVSRVVIRRRVNSRWEDDVLVQTAYSCDVEVEEHRSIVYRIGEKLDLRATNRRLLGRYRMYMPRRLLYLVQSWIRLGVGIARAKWNPQNRCSVAGGASEIVFLLGSSAHKHVENIVSLMREFQRRGGYWPVALCWGAVGGARDIRREGLQAGELEGWFPLSRWPEVVRCTRWTWKRAIDRKKDLCQNPAISYREVSLGPLLGPSLEYFFQEAIVRRLALKISAENYFEEHRPAALKLWGDGVLEYGAICCNIVHRVCDALTFYYNWGGVEWPYFKKGSNLYLVAGELEKRRFNRQGVPLEQIAVVGLGRYDHLAHFTKEYSAVDSRRWLNLHLDKEFYVLYAASNIIRGVSSSRELFLVAEALIKFFKNHSNAVLIIKPHPGDNSGIIMQLVNQYKSANIFLIDKKTLPYHCINAADATITKFSIVGIESMLLNKPLISIVMDEETRWQDIYGDVAERFHNTQDMLAFLELLICNPEERQRWEQGQQDLRQGFLLQRFRREGQAATKMMADAIEKHLRIHRRMVQNGAKRSQDSS